MNLESLISHLIKQVHYQSFLNEDTNDESIQNVQNDSQIKPFLDESLYEDIEYLDKNDLENMEYLECVDTNDIDVVVGDTELATDSTSNVRSLLYETFLSLVLCLLFLAKFLSECVSSSNVINNQMQRLKARVKLLQIENCNLRCCAKTEIAKSGTIMNRLKNLEEVIGCIFNLDQLNILKKKLKRPKKWHDETILKALKTKFACGKRGYTSLINDGHPLPSLRVLRQRLQGIDFKPGILSDVFTFLKVKVKSFTECERECFLVMDEMSIMEGK